MAQRGSVNKVIIVGHLGRDPETRYTPSGMATARFSVATNESRKDENGKLVEHTEWHNVVVFDKLAEFANDWLRKGQLVYLEGRLQTRDWEDKEGVRRSRTEIVAHTITMLGAKKEVSGDVGEEVQEVVESVPEQKKEAEGKGKDESKKGNKDEIPF